MSTEPDLVVIGAGPAGTAASIAASACGLRTVLVDSARTSGGQVYRAMPAQFKSGGGTKQDSDLSAGEHQRAALHDSDTILAFNRQVWSVQQDLRVDAIGPDGPEHWRPKAVLLATGAHERVVPFPGWTLPGVIGLAAATILLKSQRVLPGQRTVVAGCGPLLALVAFTIIKNGGEVAAVLDLSSKADWLRTMPALLNQPADLRRGLQWRRHLHAMKVPWLYQHSVREIVSDGQRLRVIAGQVHANGESKGQRTQQFSADCVAVGHGLVPSTDITRLLGAEHQYHGDKGGWVPVLDDDQRSTLKGLYAAGDGTGIRGAIVSHHAGYIGGYTTALDLGFINTPRFAALTAKHRKKIRRAMRSGAAMARHMQERSGLVRSIADDTVVCRCEDVTRQDIETALKQGAVDMNQLKSWSRCGMGPCQGRMCGDNVAALIANRGKIRKQVGLFSARVPLRPIDLGTFTGEFEYDDIPIPTAAPL